MFKEIEINGKALGFLINGATPYLYKNVFHEDLYTGIQVNRLTLARLAEEGKIQLNSQDDETETETEEQPLVPMTEEEQLQLIKANNASNDIAIKLAFIANCQAENKSFTTLSVKSFYKWLEQFGALTLIDGDALGTIMQMLDDDSESTSEAKNQ